MTIRTRNRLIAFSIMAAPFIFLLCLVLFWNAGPLPPVPPLPNPNGYDDLVKAANALGTNMGGYNETNAVQIRQIVSVNAAALSLARAGLSNECRVPIQYSQSYLSNHLEELAGLKRLAQAFIAEGQLAEMDNRPADAAKSYLDTIHLGNESCRSGVLIDELVGIAIEAIGTSHLLTLVPQLDAKSCRAASATLETLDSQGQTWDELMQQESAWSHGAFPGLRYKLVRWMTRKSTMPAIETTKRKLNAQEQKTRQLMIDLAARAYELEKGKPPVDIADLVPDYLKAIPQDPFTGSNMIYSPR